jgi:hypothetical protein
MFVKGLGIVPSDLIGPVSTRSGRACASGLASRASSSTRSSRTRSCPPISAASTSSPPIARSYLTEEKRLWNLAEWAFFLDNLRDQVLKQEGRFALRLAKQEHKGGERLRRSDDELVDFMAERGATQLKSVLLFDPLR